MTRTVLVVDDEVDIAVTLQALLELEGFRAIVAHDGVDALRMVLEERPDLVVTDMTMPRMDGSELIAHIRSDPAVRDTPVIAISAVERRGIRPFFRKPFDPDRLIALIRQMLGD